MNDRVITGNPSFSSKWDPSPTKLGDGPPSPCRNLPKPTSQNPVKCGSSRKIQQRRENQAKDFLRKWQNHTRAKTHSRYAPKSEFHYARFQPRGKVEAKVFTPNQRSQHSPPRKAFYLRNAIPNATTLLSFHEIHPLRAVRHKRSHDQPLPLRRRAVLPRVVKSASGRSSRLLINHPIQGFGQ